MDVISRFRAARRSGELAVLEGFHAVKHAARFGALLREVVTADRENALELARRLAPDVVEVFEGATTLPEEAFRELVPSAPGTGVVAVAGRKAWSLEEALPGTAPDPTVLLEHPSNLGNIGAVIRNAAGLGAGGVVVVGEHDPWHPDVVKGAAGLQYAVPVAGCRRVSDLALEERSVPLLAVDPEGPPLRPGSIPAGAVLAFGSEREGLSRELGALCHQTASIPMREGVSSLNLATTTGITLFTWALQAR